MPPKLFEWFCKVQAWNAMERQVDNSLHYNQFIRLVQHRGWTHSNDEWRTETLIDRLPTVQHSLESADIEAMYDTVVKHIVTVTRSDRSNECAALTEDQILQLGFDDFITDGNGVLDKPETFQTTEDKIYIHAFWTLRNYPSPLSRNDFKGPCPNVVLGNDRLHRVVIL